jgi:hypothetical protein
MVVALFGVLAAEAALRAIEDIRDRGRYRELWALVDGEPVLLWRTTDATRFGIVCRALVRARDGVSTAKGHGDRGADGQPVRHGHGQRDRVNPDADDRQTQRPPGERLRASRLPAPSVRTSAVTTPRTWSTRSDTWRAPAAGGTRCRSTSHPRGAHRTDLGGPT